MVRPFIFASLYSLSAITMDGWHFMTGLCSEAGLDDMSASRNSRDSCSTAGLDGKSAPHHSRHPAAQLDGTSGLRCSIADAGVDGENNPTRKDSHEE